MTRRRTFPLLPLMPCRRRLSPAARRWSYSSSVNARLVYRVGLKQDVHQLLLGISEFYDDYSESYNDSAFARTENVPGALFEYTYKPNGAITMMGGMRYDIHNIYGTLMYQIK